MFRGVVDPTVPGPKPLPDFPQPWAFAQDVAMLRSVRTTLPGLAMTDSGGSRRALSALDACARSTHFLSERL